MPVISSKMPAKTTKLRRILPAGQPQQYIVIGNGYGSVVPPSTKKQIVVDVPIVKTAIQPIQPLNANVVPLVQISRAPRQFVTTVPPKVIPIEQALKAVAAANVQPARRIVVVDPNQQYISKRQTPTAGILVSNSGGLPHAPASEPKIVVKQAAAAAAPTRQKTLSVSLPQAKQPEFKRVSESFTVVPQTVKHVSSVPNTLQGKTVTRKVIITQPTRPPAKTVVSKGPAIPRMPRAMVHALQRTFAPDYGRPKALLVKDIDATRMALELEELSNGTEYLTL